MFRQERHNRKTNIALACLGQVKSRVKGHHVYDHNYKVNEKLECFLEPENEYSKNAIIVKSKDIEKRYHCKVQRHCCRTCSRSAGRKVVSFDETMEDI